MSRIEQTVRLSPESIDEAIKTLTTLKKSIRQGTPEMLNELADSGAESYRQYYAGSRYDGIRGDPEVTVSRATQKKLRAGITATGSEVLFIEFGTGIRYPDTHPDSSRLGMERGKYGQGKGASPHGWWFCEDPADKSGARHTYGNPANMCLYYTRNDVKRIALETARRCLGI